MSIKYKSFLYCKLHPNGHLIKAQNNFIKCSIVAKCSILKYQLSNLLQERHFKPENDDLDVYTKYTDTSYDDHDIGEALEAMEATPVDIKQHPMI